MKIADKLAKVDESYTVTMVDNGFVFEIGGRDYDEEWSRAKFIVFTVEELIELIQEAPELPRE